MNKKVVAVAAVALLAVAAVAVYVVMDKDRDSSFSVIAQVNTEGSGLYIKESVLSDRGGLSAFYSVDELGAITIDESNAPAWSKLIMGTPGTTSIQHVQLQTIVEEQLGLKFRLYQFGSALKSDTVYYVSNVTNAVGALNDSIINGGILWQPQYQAIVDDADGGFTSLALTNDIFPGHPCCILAASNSFLGSNEDATVRFLAGYIDGVDWVNHALEHPGSDDYLELVNLAIDKTGMAFTEDTVKAALETITYTYGSGADDPLADLKASVSDLIDTLDALDQLQKSVRDLGFADSEAFVDRFIDGSYLSAALEDADVTGPRTTVTVAVIAGDIHQIALHAAMYKGFFADHGINVSLSSAANGAGVAVSIQNGTASFGLLGAPPATIATINSQLIKA